MSTRESASGIGPVSSPGGVGDGGEGVGRVDPAVAEVQGPFGPFSIGEMVVQRIWARGDFLQEGLRTLDGRSVRVLEPGTWNRQEGPDFRDAVLELGGVRRAGDVEIHLREADWRAHGHDYDPRFRDVVLHVVLFPERAQPEGGPDLFGHYPPVLVLLPLLRHDLEEYACAGWRASPGRVEELAEEWRAGPGPERVARLLEKASLRWRQKLRFARQRWQREGRDAAYHQFALEVLGYRRNRAPMSALALRFPLARIAADRPDPAALMGAVEAWKLAGLRPANHPRRRLGQYLRLVEFSPVWPEQALAWARELARAVPAVAGTAAFRRAARLPEWRRRLENEVLGGFLAGPRLDTLVCDALLPLAAAEDGADGLMPAWWHWYAGDFPQAGPRFLRAADLAGLRGWPAGNGLLQGVLQVLLEAG